LYRDDRTKDVRNLVRNCFNLSAFVCRARDFSR
jgi:hypothetical protein